MNKPPIRYRGPRAFSELLRPAVADALKKRGFATADILSHWPDIVGERLATQSSPMQIQWPPRPKIEIANAAPQPATLVLRVESAFALEVEMGAAQIIERINAVFGWRCIGKVRIRQGPVSKHEKPPRPVVPQLDPTTRRKLSDNLGGIEESGLREALERLGRNVLGQKKAPSR